MSDSHQKNIKKVKPLTLRTNFSWTLVGNIIYSASQWGMLVVIAKLGSPEMVGQFTLGLAVTAPVIMFTNLQLRQIQATDAKQEYLFGDYLGLRLIFTFLALVAIAVITIVAGYRWETAIAILIISCAKAFEAISDVLCGLIQYHERMDRIAISLIVKGPLSLFMLAMGIHLTGNILGGLVGMAIAWGLILILDISFGASILRANFNNDASLVSTNNSSRSLIQPRWHLKTLIKLVRLALPLGFVMMLISLNVNIPRYFLERYLGERDLGIFGAISYLMVAGNIVVSALAQSATPRLAKYYATGNRNGFLALILKLSAIVGLPGIGGVLLALVAGKEILTILYRPEYASYTDVFVLLMIAAGINYTFAFLGYARTAARYFLIQVPLSFLVTGASALTCFWLIPSMGMKGAAISLVIAAIVEAVSNFWVVLHALKHIKKAIPEENEYDVT